MLLSVQRWFCTCSNPHICRFVICAGDIASSDQWRVSVSLRRYIVTLARRDSNIPDTIYIVCYIRQIYNVILQRFPFLIKFDFYACSTFWHWFWSSCFAGFGLQRGLCIGRKTVNHLWWSLPCIFCSYKLLTKVLVTWTLSCTALVGNTCLHNETSMFSYVNSDKLSYLSFLFTYKMLKLMLRWLYFLKMYPTLNKCQSICFLSAVNCSRFKTNDTKVRFCNRLVTTISTFTFTWIRFV